MKRDDWFLIFYGFMKWFMVLIRDKSRIYQYVGYFIILFPL